jgi:alkylresorcinol/alkylpyrone synthase
VSRIAAVRGVLPGHQHSQSSITESFERFVLGSRPERSALLRRFHAAAGVQTRSLALPLDAYWRLRDFDEANGAFLEVVVELAERYIAKALADSGLRPADVDLVVSTTVTGLAVPSIDARLVDRLGLRPDVKRLPLFGLGCVAGAAGIARVHDYLQGHPDDVAVLVAVELCSLTVQRDDVSTANLVASGLFGDGAAAVVLLGERRAARLDAAGPRVRASRSRMYPDTERVMGWDIGGSGFRIVLAPTVADVVRTHLRDDVGGFLAANNLSVADVGTWVAHPGGPKVIDAIIAALDLPPEALDVTRQCLGEVGNLSSASVLHVLERTLDAGLPVPGTPGVLLAMGPGFCAELVLLEW